MALVPPATHYHVSVQRSIYGEGLTAPDTGPAVTRDEGRAFVFESLRSVGEQLERQEGTVIARTDNEWHRAAREWEADPDKTLTVVRGRTYMVVGCSCPPAGPSLSYEDHPDSELIARLNTSLVLEVRRALGPR